MEILVASAIGVMTAAGTFLVLRARTFSIVLGVTLLTYAINLFLVSTGRLATNKPDILSNDVSEYTDPLPQALVLTSIVISFGMTALILAMSLRAYFELGDDGVNVREPEEIVARRRQ